ncbi:hypothetical protein R1flu_003175 [Riccia fluitans]|uniref:glucose-1-phosphate adenylyltransferase n=1 Tax=Riccia fluitans TaxID=41844 RepID=A0ABD1Y8R8_9MARC
MATYIQANIPGMISCNLRSKKVDQSSILSGSYRRPKTLLSSKCSTSGSDGLVESLWRQFDFSDRRRTSSTKINGENSKCLLNPTVALLGKKSKRVHKITRTSSLSDIAKELIVQASLKDSDMKSKVDPKSVACMILGGGAGTRLFPLTKRRAKSAVPIGGSYRLIDIQMSNCINSGLKKVYVLTQFNSAPLNRHISRSYNCSTCRDKFVEVLAATQTLEDSRWSVGTADAVRRFSWIFDDIRNQSVEYVLTLSGDHLYHMDYMDFVQSHHNSGADITVSCLPLFAMNGNEISPKDLMEVDLDTGQISYTYDDDTIHHGSKLSAMVLQSSKEKSKKTNNVASMGLYVFKKDVLLKLLNWCYPKANHFDSEVIPAAVKEFDVQAYVFTDYWQDVGTIKSYFEANLSFTDEPSKFGFYDPARPVYTSPRHLPPTIMDHSRIAHSIVAHGCFLQNCSIKHSVVGLRSRISNGVNLNDVVMLGADDYETDEEREALTLLGKIPMGIGENTRISKCIIDKDARIGKNVILTNTDGVQEANHPLEGVYIRSGIIIISEGALIHDGVVI